MKPFKTIDEQYKLLLSRGLLFTDENKAKQYLLNNNYYNVINCYAKFFMNEQDTFIQGTNFDEITHVHFFDKELKNVLFKYIIEAEKHLKSILAYRFSEAYKNTDYAYLIATSYKSEDLLEVTSLISSLSKIIKDKSRAHKDNPIKHYLQKHDTVPFWILVNYMYFGQLVHFYKHLDDSLQNKIAKDFSVFLNENLNKINVKLTPKQLLTYLENVVEIRNVIAHNNRLLGFKCKNNTAYSKEIHKQYGINPNTPRQDVFNVFIIMQCLLSKNQYAQLHNTIHKRIKNLKNDVYSIKVNIILDSIGFSDSWYNSGKLPQ